LRTYKKDTRRILKGREKKERLPGNQTVLGISSDYSQPPATKERASLVAGNGPGLQSAV